MTRVLICGGRDYKNRHRVEYTLNTLHKERNFTEVIAGGATGADTLAWAWARATGLRAHVVRADWDRIGKPAGVLRNIKMLELNPELVVAFPGGRGTAHMVKIARAKGVEVIEVQA
jgi:hypothetical protein